MADGDLAELTEALVQAHHLIENINMRCGVLMNILLSKGVIFEEEVEISERIWVNERNKSIAAKLAEVNAKKAQEESQCAAGSG